METGLLEPLGSEENEPKPERGGGGISEPGNCGSLKKDI